MLTNGMCVPTTTTPTYVPGRAARTPLASTRCSSSPEARTSRATTGSRRPSRVRRRQPLPRSPPRRRPCSRRSTWARACCLACSARPPAAAARRVKPAGQAMCGRRQRSNLFVSGGAGGADPDRRGVRPTRRPTRTKRVLAIRALDVMRIDTTITSTYLSTCGDPTQPKQLLCGGRWLEDDVIDITVTTTSSPVPRSRIGDAARLPCARQRWRQLQQRDRSPGHQHAVGCRSDESESIAPGGDDDLSVLGAAVLIAGLAARPPTLATRAASQLTAIADTRRARLRRSPTATRCRPSCRA